MYDSDLELEAELEELIATLTKSDLASEAETETPNTRSNRDQSVISGQIARGVKDENKLTDAVFDDRHPEWTGKSLKNANLALRQEWIQIRDLTVRPLLSHPAVIPPPITPAPPSKPVPPMPGPTSPGTFGFSTFDNIRNYQPNQYQAALGAQAAYQKVSSFLPYYKKIMIAAPSVSISESSTGIGNLVFSMDSRSFTEFVEDEALRNKALEIVAGGGSELVFSEDVIGIFGLGITLFEIARGLENDRLLKGFGPEHDAWVKKQQFLFVFGLMAEDLSRRNWGNGYFFSRDARDLAVELAARFAEFQPIFNQYTHYFWLDGDLARYQGNIPDRIPPSMGPAD